MATDCDVISGVAGGIQLIQFADCIAVTGGMDSKSMYKSCHICGNGYKINSL